VVRRDTPITIRNMATRNARRFGFARMARENRTQIRPLNRRLEPAERACCCETYAIEFLNKWNM